MMGHSDSLLIDINGKYLQALYDERDRAIARVRVLEADNEHLIKRHCSIVHNCDTAEQQIAELEGENTALLTHVQVLEEEKAGLECCYDVERKAHTACMSEKIELEEQAQARLLFIKSIASQMNEVEQAHEAAETMVQALQSLVRDYRTHILNDEKFCQDEADERAALVERTRILLGEEK